MDYEQYSIPFAIPSKSGILYIKEGIMLQLFDLHCDSIERYKESGTDFLSPNTHFSLGELKQFKRLCQTFAIFIPDIIRGDDAFQYFEEHRLYLMNLLTQQNTLAEMATSAHEIERITEQGKCAIVLSVEGGAVLGGKIERVAYLQQCGVKMFTLVWNGENEIGSGSVTEKGLTSFGKDVVRGLEDHNIIVDVSHLNDQGFDDLCTIARKPFIATHSNLRSVCNHPRNLRDDQFAEIVQRKGLVGLNLFQEFISEERDGGTMDNLYRHIERMLELGGENVIACGSDFDGADIHPSLKTPVAWARGAEYLVDRGIPEGVVRKIYFENALRFFEGD